jgi:hypothetical protein
MAGTSRTHDYEIDTKGYRASNDMERKLSDVFALEGKHYKDGEEECYEGERAEMSHVKT